MFKEQTKTINKLIYIGIFTLIICLIFVVSKYIGLSILISKILRSFIPVFVAIFISFLFEPIIGLFIKYGIKRKYSVLLSYVLVLLIIGLLLYFSIPSFIKQIEIFIGNIPSLISTIELFFYKLGFNIEALKINNLFNDFLISFSKSLLKYLGSSLSVIFDLFLGVSGAIFLSFDFYKFREGIKKHLPKRLKEPIIYYFKNFLPFVHKYFLGMVIDSVVIFVISIIGFSIIGIEYTLVISLIIAITNLIPIIGSYIGGIPAGIVGFSVSPTLGISAIVVVVIVQLLESNFLQPLILKNVISLHPLEGILGISLFGVLFGVIGMILSPILIVGIKLLFLPYNEKEKNQVA